MTKHNQVTIHFSGNEDPLIFGAVKPLDTTDSETNLSNPRKIPLVK